MDKQTHKLKNCFDNHIQIRQMTGVDLFCDLEKVVSLQSVHDNVSLFTSEISDTISEMVIKFGHQKLFPNTKALHTRCDSFVFLSNVHFPTDFNLLLDSVRKCIDICAHSAEMTGIPGWREQLSMWNKIIKDKYVGSSWIVLVLCPFLNAFLPLSLSAISYLSNFYFILPGCLIY